MTENVLVTGGAGFIGSHIVDALLARGHRVRVFDNLEPQVHGALREQGRWPAYCNPAAEYVLGDVRDREALGKALAGMDVVFHEAALVGVAQSMYEIERYVETNSCGTAVLLDLLANGPALRSRVRKLVVASSMSLYGEGRYRCPEHGATSPRLREDRDLAERDWDVHCPACGRSLEPIPTDEEKPLFPTSVYAITKKSQEEMCLAVGRTYGIPTVALRYFNVYGVRQALSNPYTGVAAIFSSRLLNGKPPVIYEDGRQARDFVHVSDVVQANLLAMEQPAMDGWVFNVASGRVVSIREVADTLIRQMQVEVEPQLAGQHRPGDIRHCFADIGRIAAVGFRPRVRFEEGAMELIGWVRQQTADDRSEQARAELALHGLVA